MTRSAIVQPGRPVNTVTATAPPSIWLQISENADDGDTSFGEFTNGDVTWCADSVIACEVRYVRADLAQPERKPLTDEQITELSSALWLHPRAFARAVERHHGIKEAP